MPSNSTDRRRFDAIIVGGGIAGAAVAHFLAEAGMTDVLLLERESQHAHHSTGRSAATLVEWDTNLPMQALKAMSAPFLREPPEGFCENPLLERAGILVAYREAQWNRDRHLLPAMAERGTVIVVLTPDEVVARVPVVAREHVDAAVWLPKDGHIDVHELLWSYLRNAVRRGVQRRCAVEVRGVRVESGACRGVQTDDGDFDAPWVIDAAGAWAGGIAAMAGAAPIPLTPMRRTIITFAAPEGIDPRGWPLVHDESNRLYYKPESGGFLACPMDEQTMEPCDAQPDEVVVAQTIDKLTRLAPALVPRSIQRRWAGLRTFAPDRIVVIGEDARVKGFFWLAGQGGCGIETSPAVGRIAADLLVRGCTDLVDASVYSPRRFALA